MAKFFLFFWLNLNMQFWTEAVHNFLGFNGTTKIQFSFISNMCFLGTKGSRNILLHLLKSSIYEWSPFSEHSTKITVVVTLWLVTSFLMLHVPSILRNVFSVFNVWQRLVNMFNAHDDDRVPKFQVINYLIR